MAAQVITNGYVMINTVDLSAYCKDNPLNQDVDEVEATAFSATGWKAFLAGLKSGRASLRFNQDYAAGTVHATLNTAHGTVVACKIKAANAATSATNPEFQFNALVKYTKPVGAQVGQLHETACELVVSGAITVATS